MKISVIVPIYNCEPYLPACIDSIIEQTYNNLEIILVDDGSSDGSLDICNRYAEKDRRIIVFHQENKGVSAARNQGLKLASGELFSFIDSDDTLDLDMYELLVKFLNENNADVACCGYKHIVRDEIRLVNDTKKVYVQNQEQALKSLISGYMLYGGLWNKLYKKAIVDKLSFREDIKINEDILFNFEAISNSNIIVFADYAKYNYVARFGVSACFVTSYEKKRLDNYKVNKYIYEKTRTVESLKNLAANRYLDSLITYYAICLDNNKADDCKIIKSEINDVLKCGYKVNNKLKVKVTLIYHFSWFYKLVYSVYRKVKKLIRR